MDKKSVEKNILDLKHQFNMQKIQSSLTMLSVGVLAFVSTFIWNKERLSFGIAISLIVVLISLIQYYHAKKQLRNIVQDIRKLAF